MCNDQLVSPSRKVSVPNQGAVKTETESSNFLAFKRRLRACLYQVSVSTLRQLCDDAPEWVCNPFSSVSIDFNDKRIARVISEWSQR